MTATSLLRPAAVASATRYSADGVDVVTVYAILLIAVPARLVVQPLGGAGSPASIFGLGCLLLWVWRQVRFPEARRSGGTGIRAGVGVLSVAFLASYLMAMIRPIPMLEISSADTAMLAVASWFGVLLWTHDSITDPDRLRTLISRVVVLGGLLATLGLLQYLTGDSFVDGLQIPGLVSNQPVLGLAERDGFNRPSGTAIHAIEFSVVITMLLPLAITCARHPRVARNRVWWLPAMAMVAVVPLAISRSAIVGALVGLAVLMPAWSRRAQMIGAVTAVLAGVGIFLVVPGLLGNLSRLFFHASEDSSALSRTDSYAIVWQYTERSPWFGRGLGTLLPTHRILDNQYLGLLVETGVVGLLAFLGLLVVGILVGTSCRRLLPDSFEGELGQALAASIAVGAVGMALFDGFSFPMAAGVLFLALGMVGCLDRVLKTGDADAGVAGGLHRFDAFDLV